MAGKSEPFVPYLIEGPGGSSHPVGRRFLEDETETFLRGTPVYVDVTEGLLVHNAAITNASDVVIAGFAQEDAHNLTVGGVAQLTNEGHPQNQSSAVIIPGGARPSDGACGVWLADLNCSFVGRLLEGVVVAITDLGSLFGITIDTNNYWYIDKTKTTAGAGGIITITKLIDPVGTDHGRLAFKVVQANCQFSV
jgi:hypothetical protein